MTTISGGGLPSLNLQQLYQSSPAGNSANLNESQALLASEGDSVNLSTAGVALAYESGTSTPTTYDDPFPGDHPPPPKEDA
ncbi:hypothetical protein [Acanthopleuribacter pedis]|uniref:Uncharacterized protein n=1 Tax=Acanthopleuribacter pedis TaxID=442870 RepID=A0A8J7U6Y0_9BACT|nr:hypothetical protein [Acanthopleuribacter pedis]MBO1321898.1 hypothetical protein [Acanthopleuribacter pedis]